MKGSSTEWRGVSGFDICIEGTVQREQGVWHLRVCVCVCVCVSWERGSRKREKGSQYKEVILHTCDTSLGEGGAKDGMRSGENRKIGQQRHRQTGTQEVVRRKQEARVHMWLLQLSRWLSSWEHLVAAVQTDILFNYRAKLFHGSRFQLVFVRKSRCQFPRVIILVYSHLDTLPLCQVHVQVEHGAMSVPTFHSHHMHSFFGDSNTPVALVHTPRIEQTQRGNTHT